MKLSGTVFGLLALSIIPMLAPRAWSWLALLAVAPLAFLWIARRHP